MKKRGGKIAQTAAALSAVALVTTSCSSSSEKTSSTSKSGGTTSSSSSTSYTPATPKKVTGKAGSVTVLASGDVITQPGILPVARANAGGKGYNYEPFFAALSGVTSKADVSICQMENPLSPDDTDLSRELSFNAPHEMAEAIKKVGFDGCSTANNHAYDRQATGVINTRKVMAAAGLKAAGPGSSNDEDGQPVFYKSGDFTIAQLSYSYTLTNMKVAEAKSKSPWIAKENFRLATAAGIEKQADAARKAGADLVLVSLHWGVEYHAMPDAEQTTMANQLLKSGAVDWIIGNHPHAVEPCQKINGRYVNYALGNTFSGQSVAAFPSTIHGALASVTFTRDDAGNITEKESFQPTYNVPSTHVVELATSTQHAADYASVKKVMGSMGCDATPAS